MRIGCFGTLNRIEDIEKAGFDSVELDIGELVSLGETAFSEWAERVKSSRLGTEVFSGLLPLDVRIFADTFDEARWLDYMETGIERAAKLGGHMVPFGAGKCRSIPKDAKDPEKYAERLCAFVKKICRILGKYDMELAIEPLGPQNSNYINTIGEAAVFAEMVGEKNCGIMCDLRHMYKSCDSLGDIARCQSRLRHAHIDFPRGTRRCFPKETDGFDYRPYLKALKEIHYKGILTIEADPCDDFLTEASESLLYLQNLL